MHSVLAALIKCPTSLFTWMSKRGLKCLTVLAKQSNWTSGPQLSFQIPAAHRCCRTEVFHSSQLKNDGISDATTHLLESSPRIMRKMIKN